MRNFRVILGVSVSVLAMVSPSGGAFAQNATEADDTENAENRGLGTIVVTAQRREENLQSTPISISAISGEDLRNRDISNPERLAEEIPNLSIGDGTGRGRSGAQVSIRGVNEARVSPVLEPGVAIYIDDVYYGRPQTSFLRLFDTERVEVLRGPQGTLFGKNAAGGAIRFIGVRPSFNGVEGYVDFTAGSRDRFDARGAINLPLADNLALRISAGTLNQDGYVERLTDGYRLGNENTDSVSGKLLWQPVDTVEILISGDYTYGDTDNGAQKLIDYYRFNGSPDTPGPNPLPVCTTANCAAQSNTPLPSAVANWNRYWGGTPLAYAPAIPNSLYQVAGLSDVSQTISESYGLSLDINIELGGLGDLRSLTGYRSVDQFNSNDPDDHANVKTFFGGQNDEGTEFWSQELLLNGNYADGRLNTVVGLYYSLDKPFRNDIRADDARRRFGFEIERNFQQARTESRGAFGQATFDITDELSLTAGIRYTSDKKEYTVSQTVQWDFALAALASQFGRPTITPTIQTQPDGTLCNTGIQGTECVRVAPLTGGDTFNAWTPRFAAEYQFSDSFMIYASAAKGFKGGGTNDTVADIDTPFAAESIWSYEAGVRTDWLDRRLRINATYFYSEYSDKQITVTASPDCVNRCTTNVGDAIIQGFEVESRALLFDSLTLYANVGYLDAEWDEITNLTAGVTLDSPFSRSPKWTVSAGFSHELELSEDFNLLSSAGYSYISQQQSSPQDSTTITIAGRELVNARLGLEVESLDMTFSLFCSNCLDKEYITGGAAWAGGTGNTNGNPLFDVKPDAGLASPLGTAPPSITYVNVGEPRAFGFQVRKRF
jgi:iron complex outermembrane recepter protein